MNFSHFRVRDGMAYFYHLLVELPSFAWDFYCQLCHFVFLSLCLSPLSLCLSPLPHYIYISPIYLSISPLYISISPIYLSISPLYLSISPLYLSISPIYLSISLSLHSTSVSLPPPPSLFPDKKFPALDPIPSFRSKFDDSTFI